MKIAKCILGVLCLILPILLLLEGECLPKTTQPIRATFTLSMEGVFIAWCVVDFISRAKERANRQERFYVLKRCCRYFMLWILWKIYIIALFLIAITLFGLPLEQ